MASSPVGRALSRTTTAASSRRRRRAFHSRLRPDRGPGGSRAAIAASAPSSCSPRTTRCRASGRGRAADGGEAPEALTAARYRLNDRDAEEFLHHRQVELLARRARHVGHVQAEDRVRAGNEDLREEDEVPLELHRVGDDDHDVGAARELFLGDALLGGERA
jgi:hypothetical protein